MNRSTNATVPTADTPFRIGSITKVFAALLTLAAYQGPHISFLQFTSPLIDGLLSSLDDPVAKYYSAFQPQPPLSNPNQKIDPITFRHLLSQLSGLQREVNCDDVCNITTAQAVATISSSNLLWPPNTRPSYSNLGFALLGNLVAETFYGLDFETAVNKRIISPLGLQNTGVTITPAYAPRFANSALGLNTCRVAARMPVGYAPDGSTEPLMDIGWITPAGQMYSSTKCVPH